MHPVKSLKTKDYKDKANYSKTKTISKLAFKVHLHETDAHRLPVKCMSVKRLLSLPNAIDWSYIKTAQLCIIHTLCTIIYLSIINLHHTPQFNTYTQNNVYGSAIMTAVIARVNPVHLINVDQCLAAAN